MALTGLHGSAVLKGALDRKVHSLLDSPAAVTNKQLAAELGCTRRQASKFRQKAGIASYIDLTHPDAATIKRLCIEVMDEYEAATKGL